MEDNANMTVQQKLRKFINRFGYKKIFIAFILVLIFIICIVLIAINTNKDTAIEYSHNDYYKEQPNSYVISSPVTSYPSSAEIFDMDEFCKSLPDVKFNGSSISILDKLVFDINDNDWIFKKHDCRSYYVEYIMKPGLQTCLQTIILVVYPYNENYSFDVNSLIGQSNSWHIGSTKEFEFINDYNSITKEQIDRVIAEDETLKNEIGVGETPYPTKALSPIGLGNSSHVYMNIDDKYLMLFLSSHYVPEGCNPSYQKCSCEGEVKPLITSFFDNIQKTNYLNSYSSLVKYPNVDKFLDKFYTNVDRNNEDAFKTAYELSSKSLSFEEFKNLYSGVDYISYVPYSVKNIEKNIYEFDVLIYESSALSRYKVTAEVEVNSKGEITRFKKIISSVLQ